MNSHLCNGKSSESSTPKHRCITYPTGTTGRVRETVSAVGFTLLAMAKVLWNTVLTSSREKVALKKIDIKGVKLVDPLRTYGSLGAEDQVTVKFPAEVGLIGVFRVRAEARGATAAARRLTNPKIQHKRFYIDRRERTRAC